jgi:hypothetical protein
MPKLVTVYVLIYILNLMSMDLGYRQVFCRYLTVMHKTQHLQAVNPVSPFPTFWV